MAHWSRYQFANGYGASVIRHQNSHGGDEGLFEVLDASGNPVISHQNSYGGDEGLFEVAVLDASGNVDFTTSVTDDVIGRLTAEDLHGVLCQISALGE